ncbi:neutral alpha-glucosidase, partial [Trifolium medium]|nr:neutral alpha-glucosidase [Trifolium medium]
MVFSSPALSPWDERSLSTEKAIQIPDVEDEVSGPKGLELSRTPIELKS